MCTVFKQQHISHSATKSKYCLTFVMSKWPYLLWLLTHTVQVDTVIALIAVYLLMLHCGSLAYSLVCWGIGCTALIEHNDVILKAGVARAQRDTINKGLVAMCRIMIQRKSAFICTSLSTRDIPRNDWYQGWIICHLKHILSIYVSLDSVLGRPTYLASCTWMSMYWRSDLYFGLWSTFPFLSLKRL